MQTRPPLFRGWRLLLLGAFPSSIVAHAFAVDLLVFNNNNAGAGSLRQAVTDNNGLGGGNTIIFSNTVTGTITLTGGELVIASNVNIVGPGPEVLAVSGNNVSRVFRITNATATISGLNIVNGRANASSGGGILNNGTLLLNDCIVSNCFAQLSGGGIDSFGSTKIASIVRSSIINNQSPGYAAGLDGWVRLTNCTVAGNVGAVAVGGGSVIWSTTIAGNMGRGMYGGGSPPPVVGNSILAGNSDLDALSSFTSAGYNLIGKGDQASGFTALGDQVGSTNSPLTPNLRPLGFHGGPTPTTPPLAGSLAIDQGKSFGLTTDQRGRVRTYDDPGVFNATLGDGTDIGAVEALPISSPLVVTTTNDAGPGSLRQTIFRASSFENDYITFATNVGTIRLTSGELVVNKSLSIEGPGIHWFGTPAPRKLTISGNNTSRVFNLSGGNVSLYGLTIAHGTANQGGGILVSAGNHSIYGCYITSNASTYTGGGLQVNNAILYLEGCSFTHNEAIYSGGGIYQGGSNLFSSILDLYNCTIASNHAAAISDPFVQPRGGGIGRSGGSLAIYSSTIASNSSTYYGGGIETIDSPNTTDIRGSIIAGNSAGSFGPDVIGTFDTGGYNIIGNTNNSTGFGEEPGDQLNVNPLLGPLGDYGGPTPTMALRADSPAIDKSKRFGLVTDQRDFDRTVDDTTIPNASGGDGTDIGAFEVDPSLRIVELRRVGSDIALSLTTVLGRNYRAEHTNELASGNWAVFTNNVPGNGYLLWVTNYGGANQPRRYYRGAIVP